MAKTWFLVEFSNGKKKSKRSPRDLAVVEMYRGRVEEALSGAAVSDTEDCIKK